MVDSSKIEKWIPMQNIVLILSFLTWRNITL